MNCAPQCRQMVKAGHKRETMDYILNNIEAFIDSKYKIAIN